jgi:hypothetical protein
MSISSHPQEIPELLSSAPLFPGFLSTPAQIVLGFHFRESSTRGGRHEAIEPPSLYPMFQSTPPRGGRLRKAGTCNTANSFQSTPPEFSRKCNPLNTYYIQITRSDFQSVFGAGRMALGNSSGSFGRSFPAVFAEQRNPTTKHFFPNSGTTAFLTGQPFSVVLREHC